MPFNKLFLPTIGSAVSSPARRLGTKKNICSLSDKKKRIGSEPSLPYLLPPLSTKKYAVRAQRKVGAHRMRGRKGEFARGKEMSRLTFNYLRERVDGMEDQSIL